MAHDVRHAADVGSIHVETCGAGRESGGYKDKAIPAESCMGFVLSARPMRAFVYQGNSGNMICDFRMVKYG